MKVKLALIGVGGYGATILQALASCVADDSYELVCTADPFFALSPEYPDLQKRGIPVYKEAETMFENHTVDLTVIASPLDLHKKQILLALENQSHVLCEKPLVPTIQEAKEIQKTVQRSGKKLGVGFQWSFSPTMLSLKKDILKGNLGAPISLKSLVSWKRYDSYYSSAWKGNLRDPYGNWTMDCVITNATAHYLHNMLFLMGDALDEAKLPESLWAEAYRLLDIQTLDTCFLKGRFENGCDLFFAASHCPDINDDPRLIYEFEEGIVYMNHYDRTSRVTLHRRDGRVIDYGNPQTMEALSDKLTTMIRAISEDAEIPCKVKTVEPHLRICNAVFDECTIHPFATDRIFRETDPETGKFIYGLYDDMTRCYLLSAMPATCGFDWASESVEIHPQTMESFRGNRF